MKNLFFVASASIATCVMSCVLAAPCCEKSQSTTYHLTPMHHATTRNQSIRPVSMARKDIIDTAVGAGSFSTLAAALDAADLITTLKGDGPFTVFAPTDEAFKKLPAGTVEMLLKPENKEKLMAVLLLHVVPGEVFASDVVSLSEAKTAGGETVKFSTRSGVKVGTASGISNIVKTDIKASNGVIHVIDAVILP